MEYSFYRFQRSIIRSLLSLGLGILLILNSRNVMDYLIFVLGGIFLMMGVFALISSLTHKRNFGTSEISGIGSIILGLLLLVFSEEFSKVFFYFLGFLLLFAAMGQFATLSVLRRLGGSRKTGNYIIAALIFLTGLFMLFRPVDSQSTMFIIFGTAIVLYAVTDMINHYRLYRFFKCRNKENYPLQYGREEIRDVEYEEIDE